MLNDTLKTLRTQKGMTQEELAIRLHVTRQTISKWEKGLSVPDAQMLIRIADVFEVSASELLGDNRSKGNSEIGNQNAPSIVEQLSRINEQLAIKNKRARTVWKVVIGVIVAIIAFLILWLSLTMVSFRGLTQTTMSTTEITHHRIEGVAFVAAVIPSFSFFPY